MMALFGALCWGIAPVFGKIGLRGVNTSDGLAARTIITVLLVWGWMFTRGGFQRIFVIPKRNWAYLAAEAFLATFAGDLAYYAALKRGDAGQTALILAAAPLLTVWAGWFFLSEPVNATKIIGAALIIIGVALVGLNPAY